ncbi:hypothetical protein GV819_27675 [Pseudomonas sp. Fl5BN2]|uniref:hypothetical protein n=1 Tax=Pseudomonas sp. Fl5BN2 TaxID=2697652 RepID=UPI001378F6D3|nr:hypothetical protein [Pseudomonas sp. Fl5BN2]NBF06072.1 hypothetical protein [Pseudomonas sp. Fl5BN2]
MRSADAAKLATAQMELKKANEAYSLPARTQVNDQKAVTEAEQAGRDLAGLDKSASEPVTDAMLKRVEDAIRPQGLDPDC